MGLILQKRLRRDNLLLVFLFVTSFGWSHELKRFTNTITDTNYFDGSLNEKKGLLEFEQTASFSSVHLNSLIIEETSTYLEPITLAALNVAATTANTLWTTGDAETTWGNSWEPLITYLPTNVKKTGNGNLIVTSDQPTNVTSNTHNNVCKTATYSADLESEWIDSTEANRTFETSDYFITTWTTLTDGESITIPTNPNLTYNYDVDWENNGNWETGFAGTASHTYPTAGTYTVAIRGSFPHFFMANESNGQEKLSSIEQWGTTMWESMFGAFDGCVNLIYNATDTPNLSVTTNMGHMFNGATQFNGDLSNWDVSNVTNMESMFSSASTFNGDISSWNVSNVNNMSNMFYQATSFNQNIGNWNVSNVQQMTDMFAGVTLSIANYDALLNGWSELTLFNGVNFSAGNSEYCNSSDARNTIITVYGWVITDNGQNCPGICGEVTEYTTLNGWSNGTPNTSKTAIFADDYDTVLGNINACAIEINPGVTVTVSEGTTIRTEYDININGDLVFISSATGNGEIATMGPTSVINGNATVQRYMQNKRSYRMVSSSVNTTTSIHDNWQEGATSNADNPNPGFGTHITGTTTDQTNGFDATITGNASMFTVNLAAQQFEPIANTDVNTLSAGEAYLLFVRGDRSIDLSNDFAAGETVLRAKGTLVTGSNTQNFATTNAGDFVMFGNPYQSAVDLSSALNGSTNINTGFYHMYDSSLGNHGAYVTVSLPGAANTSGSTANQFLQPGQAAQVATLADGASAITFNEIDRAPGNFTSTNANPMTANNMLTVQLYTTDNFNNGGPVHDSFGIIFDDSNSNEITPADAVKPMNFYENLGINNNGTYLSIEQREMPQLAEVYSMYTSGYQSSEYTLKVTVDGLEANFLYLDDSFTGTSTLLETGENSFSFRVDANDALSIVTDRFSIRTEQRLGVDENSLLAGVRLFPNPLNGDTFYINAPKLNGEQLSVNISDLTGRSIYEQTLDCNDNTLTIPMSNNIASGVYLVTLKNGDNSQTYRLIKE